MNFEKSFINSEKMKNRPSPNKGKNCLKNIREKYLKHLKGDINNEF